MNCHCLHSLEDQEDAVVTTLGLVDKRLNNTKNQMIQTQQPHGQEQDQQQQIIVIISSSIASLV